MLLLLLLGTAAAASVARARDDPPVRDDYRYTIEPAYGPDYDSQPWNGPSWCPPTEFATGFQQKTDAWCSGGGECTGLNAVRMFCGLVGEDSYINEATPFYEGPFGDWHEEHLCHPKDFLKHGQMEYQEYQGIWVDDAAAGGISGMCADGLDLDAGSDIHYTSDSVWGPFVTCPEETVMCGFETKGSTAFPDNGEITRVRYMCCELPAAPTGPPTPTARA
jgi:hypothetical protein